MTRAQLDWGTLTLREPSPEDVERYADVLARAYNDPKNAPLLGHVDEMDRDDVIEHYIDLLADDAIPFMLFDDGSLVGDGDLRRIDRRLGAAELSFLIASPTAQGKGLGTKLALLLATFGFRVLGLTTIFASVAPQNVASLRVFEKLGFVLDNSALARSFAEEPSDRVFTIDRAAFDRLHSVTLWGSLWGSNPDETDNERYHHRNSDPVAGACKLAGDAARGRRMERRRNKTPAQLDREITKALTLEPPRIRRLGYVTGLPVYLVSGEKVRNEIDIDFTQGGNEAAYPGYVPAGEIWIDDAMHSLDRIATIFHEIVERNLVLYGGMDYDDAHEIACKREVEWRKELARKRPKSTDLRLVTAALKPYRDEAKPSGKRPGKPSRTIGS